jgi:hypothetical protein
VAIPRSISIRVHSEISFLKKLLLPEGISKVIRDYELVLAN